jgi:hypothetical protein
MFLIIFLLFFTQLFSIKEASQNFTGELFLGSPLESESCLCYKRKKVIGKISFGASAFFFIGGLILKKKSVPYWWMPFIPSGCCLPIAVFTKKNINKIDFYIENSLIIMNYAYGEFVKKFMPEANNNEKKSYKELIDLMILNNEIKKILNFYCCQKKMVYINNIQLEDYRKALKKIHKKIDIEKIVQEIFQKNQPDKLPGEGEEGNLMKMVREE